MRPNFVHLHSHSDYSYLDAIVTIDQYSKYVQTTGNRIAITEHGNLCSAGQLIASHDDRFILGLQAYYVDSYDQADRDNRYHMLLLARNRAGWKSLVKINNIACQHFHRKPIISFDDLVKASTDLVVTSACQGNKISRLVLKDDISGAQKLVEVYKQAFPEFYLQLQYGTSENRPKINKQLIRMAKKFNVPLVLTNDVHLARPQDQLSKQIMEFINFGKKQGGHDYSNLWLCDGQQLLKRVPDDQRQIALQAMRNTVKIAYQKIDQKLISSIDVSIKLPKVDTAGMLTEAVTKLKSLGLDKKQFQRYLQRLKYQVKVISDIGAMGYFKVVRDTVKLATQNNVYSGMGRGSRRRSLLSYLLGITSVDPIKYGLMFQRFINPAMKIKTAEDLPDADLDFQDSDKLRQLLRVKYGQLNVAQGATFSTYSPKILLKDILKYYDVSFQTANRMTKYFDIIQQDIKRKAEDKAPDFSLQVLQTYKQFNQVFNQFPQALVPFRTLYKRKRHIGRHAGAVVYLQNLTELIPQYRSKGQVVTAWGQAGGNIKTLSKNGFVKFDFLGLKTLRIIHRAVDLIQKNYGKKIDFKNINCQDGRVYQNTFNRQKFVGVFQFTGKGMRTLCKQVNPKNIQDLSAIISLYRPACLKNDFHKLYLQNKEQGQPQYIHPKIKQILQKSYGTILYQEQVFSLVKQIGGYTFDDVGLFKKYILKVGAAKKYKDYKQQCNIFRLKFVTHGSQKLGINKTQVEYLYDQIIKFASYGFCFTGSVRINTKDGYKLMKDIKVDDYVKSYDKKTRQAVYTKVVNKFDNGIKEVYNIKTKNGKQIKGVTLQHQFLCPDGFKRSLECIIYEMKDGILNRDSSIDLITSIECAGYQQVFDFQVQHPDHLYIAEDIIVSNCHRHRVSYRLIGYTCAWFLHYYPTQWLCRLINQDRQQSLPEIVKSFKKNMLPINMYKSQVQSITQKQQDGTYRVRLGFHIIKGLGQKSLRAFMRNRQQMIDPQDFIFGCTPSIAQKLISSGATDCLQSNRKRLHLAVAMTKLKGRDKLGKKNFGQIWLKLQSSAKPYKIDEMYDLQMKTFGMNIFVNVWQTYKNVIKKFIRQGKAVLDFSSFKRFDLKIAYIPVNICDIKLRKQKNGKQMAFIKFVTPSGQVQQRPVFRQTWQYLKKKISQSFQVYFRLFSVDDNGNFRLGDGEYICTQHKANTFLLNIKYILQKQPPIKDSQR